MCITKLTCEILHEGGELQYVSIAVGWNNEFFFNLQVMLAKVKSPRAGLTRVQETCSACPPATSV